MWGVYFGLPTHPMKYRYRNPLTGEVKDVENMERVYYVANGWIALGPVPNEPDTIKPLKKKRKSPDVE